MRGRLADGADVSAAVRECSCDCDRNRCRHEQHADQWQPAFAEPRDHEHDERPEHVELLFHRERPEVSQRHEVERREVRGADPDLEPVESVHERRHDVAAQVAEHLALEKRAIHRDEREQSPQCRQQATCSAQPELVKVDGAVALRLGDEQRRDEKAADHEKHLDAEEPAAEPLLVGVVHDHRHHGERAHTVERRQVAEQAGALVHEVRCVIGGIASSSASRHPRARPRLV